MKTNKIRLSILLLSVMAIFSSCSDFEYNERFDMTYDDIWHDHYVETGVEEAMFAVYEILINGYGDIMGLQDCVTDNATSNEIDTTDIDLFNSGLYTSDNNPDEIWGTYYNGIYLANRFLINSEILLNSGTLNDDYGHTAMVEQYRAEVKVLKGFFYIELMKRYGEFVIMTEADAESGNAEDDANNSVTIATLADCVAHIVTLFDEANDDMMLASRASNTYLGRATQEMIPALKSRLYLLAASMTTDNATYLEKCIEVSLESISTCTFTAYSNLFNPSNSTNHTNNVADVLFDRRNNTALTYAKANYPVSFELGCGEINPSHELVEAFYRSYKGDMSADLLNDETDPYTTLAKDTRFAATILYNGMAWGGHTLDVTEGGADASSAFVRGTETGYYLRKFIYPNITDLVTSSLTTTQSWFYLRHTEVYFNLAEALLYKTGSPTDTSYGTSAQEVLNTVRTDSTRGSMSAVSFTDYNEFLAFLRNERRVEFAFEGLYYFDVKRWCKMDSTYSPNTTVSKVVISSTGEYSKQAIDGEVRFTRVAEDYPIPTSETLNGYL